MTLGEIFLWWIIAWIIFTDQTPLKYYHKQQRKKKKGNRYEKDI